MSERRIIILGAGRTGDILEHCKLFFHQSVRKENVYEKVYSSENMLQLLPEA